MPDLQASLAQYYHERTKYHPETIASKNKSLDWDKQPLPFKDYKIGKIVDLKPYLEENIDLEQNNNRYWWRLSNLLLCSYGLTAKLPTMYGSQVYLRSAPSAGGLYPAEVYLIARGNILSPGLYNYQVLSHTLVHFWENPVWQELQNACFNHPALENTDLAILTSGVFYRSAWRYEDRAYRRIFLDTGHLLGNIELASAINGFRPYLIGGFQDEEIASLMYFAPQVEGVISVIPLQDLETNPQIIVNRTTALPSDVQTEYPQIADGDLLAYLHEATKIKKFTASTLPTKPNFQDKYNFPFCEKVSTKTNSIDWQARLSGLEKTILQRRSTRAYTGENLTLAELKALLNFTYQPQDYINQGLEEQPDYFDLSLLQTFVAVSGVSGLEEGCYYYAPDAQELRQIRFKNFRQELHFLCLGQDLGRQAAALVFHTADLEKAVAKYGDRVYRYLHMDAGHLGQRLNLAAIYFNLGVSGIAGFFDDEVNEVLGIPADEAVIYITTLGRPRTR